jgi:hypothetical protein
VGAKAGIQLRDLSVDVAAVVNGVLAVSEVFAVIEVSVARR